jgi:hypothetical protein
MEAVVEAIEASLPEARGLISFDPQVLPFPDAIDDTGIEALGDIPVTPFPEAVRRTVAIFRDRFERGELAPEEHGLEAVAASS